MHFHWQNLTDPKTAFPWHGRAWLYGLWARRAGAPAGQNFRIEWALARYSVNTFIRVALNDGDEDDIKFGLGVGGLFALWITLCNLPGWRGPGKWKQSRAQATSQTPGAWWYRNTREVSLSFFDDGLHVILWADPMEWSSKQPRWSDFSIYPLDIVYGRAEWTNTALSSELAPLTLPEGTYVVQWRLTKSVRRRPRSPFSRTRYHVDVIPVVPIPVPGKGENDWDQGDDAWHQIGVEVRPKFFNGEPAGYIRQAEAALVERLAKRRRDYGGADWRAKAPPPLDEQIRKP